MDGRINIPANPLPPLGKFFDPFQGVWSSNTQGEKIDLSVLSAHLKSDASVIYDERRVPHIFAQNLEDALFVQGYVEAQNRLFQMEFLAKVAAGELSELFGERTLPLDLEKRKRGMRYAAEKAVEGWKKQKDYHRVERYIEGINAFINQIKYRDLPIEYKLFNIKPEPWTAVKSALIFKQMTQTLAGGDEDIKYTNMLSILGKEQFDNLFPDKENYEIPVIPTEKMYKFDSIYGQNVALPQPITHPIYKAYYDSRPRGIGSNSWAVHGSRTTTGKPIFCNDPHLSLGLPSIWIEEHIVTPASNAYGVSFPGFPGIMIGFNDYITWGETNVGQDVQDLVRITWRDPKRLEYLVDNKYLKADLRVEVIKVKNKNTIFDTIRYTIFGPVYHKSLDGKNDLAMRWLAHDEPDTPEFNTFIDAMSAKNYGEYIRATEPYICPAQNFGAADNSGNIGLRVNGRFPAKFNYDGKFVEEGNTSQAIWQAYIPKYQNPQIINPSRGYIASANQISADKTYPYYFNGKFERYRNVTINGHLDTVKTVSISDMQKLQNSTYSKKADQYLTFLSNIKDSLQLDKNTGPLLHTLIKWNRHYDANKKEATYFEIFYDNLEKLTWDEFWIYKDTMDIKIPEDYRLLELLQTQPKNIFFDIKATKAIKETNLNLLELALKSTQDSITHYNKLGRNLEWAKYKPLHIYHLSRLPALSAMDIHASGCVDAVNATGMSYGPSWRMVVSLEDKVQGHAVFPGGQSGNPTSKYYKYSIDTWTKGLYHVLNNSKKIESFYDKSTQKITFKAVKK